MFWRLSKIIYPASVSVTPAQYAGNDLVIEDTHECFSLRLSAGERDIVVGRIPWL